jgi:LacI family transcriptional regulator
MALTQTQLAKKLGISQGTVSYAFQPESPIHPGTRKKILAAAERMGYRPNAAARAMRRGRFNAVGLMFSSRINQAALMPTAMWAIQQEMLARKLHLTMAPLPDDKLASEDSVPQILREWSVDGLLVSYTYEAPDQLLQLLDRHRIPAMWMNRKLDADCVYPDDGAAGRLATEHLIALGHRQIAYLSFRAPGGHYSAGDRLRGYRSAMAAAGLTSIEASPLADRDEELDHVAQWLSSADRPQAVVTYEDGEAAVVLMAAARLGLSVPGDLSLMAIRGGSGRLGGVAVTGMEIRHGQMGHRAVEQLMTKIEKPAEKLPPLAIPPTFLEGATVAPPRR